MGNSLLTTYLLQEAQLGWTQNSLALAFSREKSNNLTTCFDMLLCFFKIRRVTVTNTRSALIVCTDSLH